MTKCNPYLRFFLNLLNSDAPSLWCSNVGNTYPGVPERWKDKRRQLFQRTLSIVYVQSLPPILLSNTVEQLNTSTKLENKVRRINTKKQQQTNYQLIKGRFKNVTPEL